MSLPTYILAGYIWRDPKSSEASLKYFVTGAFSSAILAFGLALLYGATGATSYAGIAAGLAGLQADGLAADGFLVVAFVLVVTGFGFKISAVPFHSWAPDVYEGAPTPVTAFMATGVKAAAFVGFAKLFFMAAGVEWAALGAHHDHPRDPHDGRGERARAAAAQPQAHARLLEHRPRRATSRWASSPPARAATALGVSAILFYLAAYALMNLGAFGVLIWIRARRAYDYSLDGLAGLGRTMPWPAILMALFMVSLTGIPPTVGLLGQVLPVHGRHPGRPHVAGHHRRGHERGVGVLLPARGLVHVLPRGARGRRGGGRAGELAGRRHHRRHARRRSASRSWACSPARCSTPPRARSSCSSAAERAPPGAVRGRRPTTRPARLGRPLGVAPEIGVFPRLLGPRQRARAAVLLDVGARVAQLQADAVERVRAVPGRDDLVLRRGREVQAPAVDRRLADEVGAGVASSSHRQYRTSGRTALSWRGPGVG